jgi:hypothetical protein
VRPAAVLNLRLDISYLGDLAGLNTRLCLIVPHLRGVGRSTTA